MKYNLHKLVPKNSSIGAVYVTSPQDGKHFHIQDLRVLSLIPALISTELIVCSDVDRCGMYISAGVTQVYQKMRPE